MNTRPPIITPEEIERLKNTTNPETGRKYTQNDIAEMLGTSRQNISKIVNSVSHPSRTPREVALDSIPWKNVHDEHLQSRIGRSLRDHAEYVATGGRGMPEDRLKRLLSFYRRLQDRSLVVEYDPTIPPNDENKHGGYAYRSREPRDGELIIRVNEHAEMSDTAYVTWRFPPELPVVD